MKRNLGIATLAAAVLVGGGTYTAAAVTGNDDGPRAAPSAPVVAAGAPDDDERSGKQPAGPTAAQAAAAALKQTPGTVDSVGLDDDGATHWEVDVVGKDNREHELRVDAKTGAVRSGDSGADGADRDDERDDDRAALRGAGVDARQAAAAALAAHPGTVTSVDFDDDVWEVEVHVRNGGERELTVDAGTGKVTAAQDDDSADDRRDDADDRTDDRRDDADDNDGSDD